MLLKRPRGAPDAASPAPGAGRWPLAVLAFGMLLAALVRYPLIPFESPDVVNVMSLWYEFIGRNGGFAALKHRFSDQNVPYLYLLAAASALAPEASASQAIKIVSIVFDFLLAFFVHGCVRTAYPGSRLAPILAALATLFAPTMIVNSAMWGQFDAIYTTFLAACLYFLLTGRPGLACTAFGAAFAFKPQSVLLAPLLLWLLMKKDVSLHHLLPIPAVYLASMLPAWFAGRPLKDLLLIYFDLLSHHSAPRFQLSMNAPNFYQWIPSWSFHDFYPAGILFTAGIVAAVGVFLRRSRVAITPDRLVLLAAFSVLMLPCLLPKMHDRYFFPANVFTIVLAFHFPRYWYVPAVVGAATFFVYTIYLFGDYHLIPSPFWGGEAALPASAVRATVLPLPLLAILVVLGRRILLTFRSRPEG